MDTELTIRINKELKNKLKNRANKEYTTMSAIIIKLLYEYLEK